MARTRQFDRMGFMLKPEFEVITQQTCRVALQEQRRLVLSAGNHAVHWIAGD